jgi:hypothetical protein
METLNDFPVISAMSRLLLVSLAFVSSLPASAQPTQRAAGTVFYRCSSTHEFDLPGAFGRDAVLASRSGRNRTVMTVPWPANIREQVGASVEVDEQGRMSRLEINWHQRGSIGWPQVWRPDVHPIYLSAQYAEREVADPRGGMIDPASVEVSMRVVSERKMKRTLLFRLWRDGQPPDQLTLGGRATVPAWRRSAEIKLSLSDLLAFRRGDTHLHYAVAQPEAFPTLRHGRGMMIFGMVDVSILPRVLEEMETARRRLAEIVQPVGPNCTRYVEPEPSDDAFITPTFNPPREN